MDQRERTGDLQESLRSLVEDYLVNLWTGLPGIVQSYNATQNTVTVQPAIKSRTRKTDGTYNWVNLPLLRDVPVVFPGGGIYIATFPIQQGDECLVMFACRSIDGWWQQGGIQLQTQLRLHDLSDAFCIVGPRSLPKVPANISTNTVQLRTIDGTCFLELAPGGKVNITAPGGLHVTGAVVATGEGTFNGGHTVSAHIHSDPQGGSTGTPTG